MTRTTTLALLLALAIATPVRAEDAEATADPFAGHEGAAWEVAYRLAGEYMSEDAISRLNIVVYHHVAEALCDGVHVDPKGTVQGIAATHPENYSELSEDERRHWDGAMLANFGMLFGVMLAEHADKTASFCAEVQDVIAHDDWHFFEPAENAGAEPEA